MEEPTESSPVRPYLSVVHNPNGKSWIRFNNPDGHHVDITDQVENLDLSLSGAGCGVRLVLAGVPVKFDFPVDTVQVVQGVTLTAEDYNRIVLSGGASQSPGEKIASHIAGLQAAGGQFDL